MTDRQAAALRAYIDKGGFVIVDDFKQEGDFGSPGWGPFEANMKRVYPNGRFVRMNASHPIFHSFFEVDEPRGHSAGLQRRRVRSSSVSTRTTIRRSGCR